MEPTTQNNTLRSLLIFAIIGAVLLAAVILGVRWARSRSDQLASNAGQQTQQPAPAENKQEENKPAEQNNQGQSGEQSQPAQSSQPASNSPANQGSSATSSTVAHTPTHVPSTGAGDVALPIVAVVGAVFAASTYVQSRRRLARLAR